MYFGRYGHLLFFLDEDGLIVKVNQDMPDYSGTVAEDYGTAWFDNLATLPIPCAFDGFDVDFDCILQERGWNETNASDVTWKNYDPRKLEVKG